MADKASLRREIRLAKQLVVRLQEFIATATQAEVLRAADRPSLPRITKDHWIAAIGSKHRTLPRIVDVVMLRFSIDPMHRRRIVKRCAVYLNGAVKSGKIIKEGKQRKHTYRRG